MSPLPPPADVKTALGEFNSWGAVVEHFLFAAPSTITLATHEAAAKAGLQTAIREAEQPPSVWRSTHTLWANETAQRAISITPSQFLGGYFDWASRKPLFPFPGSFRLHAYDYEMDERMRDQPYGPPNGFANGYAYALLDPPHSLYSFKSSDRPPLAIGTAFLCLCDALFGNLETLEIYTWPTDCSNYFDAGHEWWGSFFWTVYAPSKNWIVTIIASTTD